MPTQKLWERLLWGTIGFWTLVMACYVVSSSHFHHDDFEHFQKIQQFPFWQQLWMPIDVHLAPLHRLLSTVIYTWFPLNFKVAVAILWGFHGLALIVLYRCLQTLEPSPWNLGGVVFCSSYLYGGVPWMWWSAGAHRLPFIALSLLCLFFFLQYLQRSEGRKLAWAFLCFLLAFGFYSKAILIPCYLAGLAFGLGHFSAPKPRRSVSLALAPFFVTSGLWGLAYLQNTAIHEVYHQFGVPVVNWDLQALGSFLWNSWAVWLTSLFSLEFIPRWSWQNGSVLGAIIAFVLYTSVGTPGSTSASTPGKWKIWLVLSVLVTLNFLMIGLSVRTQSLGAFAAFAHRYYLELMFFVILFLRLILRQVTWPRSFFLPSWRPWGAHRRAWECSGWCWG